MGTKLEINEVYATALFWDVLKRDGKLIWGKMSIVIPYYAIDVLKEAVHPSEESHCYLSFLKTMQKYGLAQQRFTIYYSV